MHVKPIHLVTGQLTGDAPTDTATSRAILQGVSDGRLHETLQVGRPHDIVAFGKHDALTDGFRDAVDIATDHGFDPTVRIAGGRAVVFHRQTVRYAWTVPDDNPIAGIRERFELVAQRVIDTLNSFGAEGIVGELPGEYCPGTYSVSMPGTGKVMGSGQRLARHASQIGGMIVVDDSDAVNSVLVPIYEALNLTMDPNVTGAVSDAVDVNTERLMERFAQSFTQEREVIGGPIDGATRDAADGFRDSHDPLILA